MISARIASARPVAARAKGGSRLLGDHTGNKLVRKRVILSPVVRYGSDISFEFIVVADKWWRTTGGGGRRCGVYIPVF
jgi:hypothetical protein